MCIWVVFRDKFYCNRNQSVRKKRHKTLEERCCHRRRRRRRRREPSARTGRARAGVGAGASGETLFGSGCLDAYVHPDACAIADLMGARGSGPPPLHRRCRPRRRSGRRRWPPLRRRRRSAVSPSTGQGRGEEPCHRPGLHIQPPSPSSQLPLQQPPATLHHSLMFCRLPKGRRSSQ